MDTASQRVPATAVTKQWKSVHRRSLAVLIQLETEAVAELRSEVRSSIADVSDELAQVGNDRARTDGMRIVRNAASTLQHTFAATLYRIKTKARVAALEQLDQELATLREDLALEGHEYEVVDPELSTHMEEDHAEAELSAASFRAAWTQAIVSIILSHDVTDVSVAILAVPKLMDKRLRRIAATEVARSYNRELSIGHDGIETKNQKQSWAPLVFKRWDGTIDSKICADCRQHDGEVTLIGLPFDSGDTIPLHVNCRCVETLLVIPIPTGKKS